MTTATLTITEFLLARIAEDEAVATAATPGPWRERSGDVETVPEFDLHRFDGMGLEVARTVESDEDAAHIARHDPARVLAECEAKRRIVEYQQMLLDSWENPSGDVPYPDVRRREKSSARSILADLAAIYADHPDYREEWRP